MEKGREEGVCKKMPCESPIQFLKNGECIFGVDLKKRGLLCGGDKRPWYSVYGDWNCQVRELSVTKTCFIFFTEGLLVPALRSHLGQDLAQAPGLGGLPR